MKNGDMVGGERSRRRWIGGANLPSTGGWRVNASAPLAELVLDDRYVGLRLRGPLPRLLRVETLSAKPTDLTEAFPIRSLLFRGVGFRRPDGREYYFGTYRIDDILDALKDRGFTVSRLNQRASQRRWLRP